MFLHHAGRMGSGQVMLFCRIPLSSCHPQIPVWCLNKPRLLIMNRADMVSQQDQQEWSNYYGSLGLSVFNTDANNGKGITKVTHCMCLHLLHARCVYLANFLVAAARLTNSRWHMSKPHHFHAIIHASHHHYVHYMQFEEACCNSTQHPYSHCCVLLRLVVPACSSFTCTRCIHVPYRSPKQLCHSARASTTGARPEGCSLDQSEQLSLASPMLANQP